MDKQQYRTQINDTVSSALGEIKTMKASLETQKTEVEKLIAQDQELQMQVDGQRAAQQQILDKTRGDEAVYAQQAANARAQLAQIQAQQRAALLAATNGGRDTSGSIGSFQFRNFSGNLGSCGGGYPSAYCSIPLDAGVDSWQLYTRECVSYTAWAAYSRFGKDVRGFGGAGMAYQWPGTSLRMGASVDSNPTVGSVAIAPISSFAPVGHAMLVEAVLGDGWVRVSQYNFYGTGEYSTMDLKASSARYIHFQDR
jgi:surface antigen